MKDKIIEILKKFARIVVEMTHEERSILEAHIEPFASRIYSLYTTEISEGEIVNGYKDHINKHGELESYRWMIGVEWALSKGSKGVSDGNTNVFVRDDCIFKYCPHPEQCKDECQCKADDLNEKIDKSNKIIDKMSDFSNFDMNEPYT